jgi:hypothetical protein
MNIKLDNVRLSYPNLFEAKAGPEGGELKYNASFLLSKVDNPEGIKAMQGAILKAAEAQWGAGNAKWSDSKLYVKKSDGKAGVIKTCLRDGSEKPDTAGYGDEVVFFSASNKMPPAVVDKNPHQRLEKNSGRPYAGCFVNVAIRLWAQDNQFGKRINAQLQAVQFIGDGESFGDAPIDPTSVFTNVGGDENPFAPEGGGETQEPDGIPF